MQFECDRFRGSLLGLACGDAVGAAVEFAPRGSFPPVTGMAGGGPFDLPAGYWTDDTSMALCLAESLIARRGHDPHDQMRRYLAWYRDGVWSSKGYCFDIGNATRQALHRFEQSGDPLAGSQNPHSAGNGSIMRLAPVPMAYALRPAELRQRARESSLTTHAAEECLIACEHLGELLGQALRGELDLAALRPLAARPESEIRGSGYVRESLEAALWAFAGSDSFEHAVLRAANLGDDADTTAAITGQLAGAYYGWSGIPSHWRDTCYRAAEIVGLSEELFALAWDLGTAE